MGTGGADKDQALRSSGKVTTTSILARKGGEKITSVTAYDYSTAKLVDAAGIDIILVGDSLGMVMLGYPDTTRVTLAEMLHHVKAVSRADPAALVVADLPFLSFGVTIRDTVRNAGRFIREAGAEAVKLEGGMRVRAEIRALVDCQIPVMGHVGLTPQSVHSLGGFKVQGRTQKAAEQILRDAIAVQESGAFALVLESIPAELAERITHEVDIPTVGIGAGPHCDGQVLVIHDMFHLFDDFSPRFVKVYADLGESMREALRRYCDEVRAGRFPGKEHSF